MGCCGEAKRGIKSTATKVRQIATGYINLASGKEYEFTAERIRACRRCGDRHWIKRALFCSICKCYIPAKARVEENTCPAGKWSE